jgi:glycine/D-amino acid oxidase-like deaminating enzyme
MSNPRHVLIVGAGIIGASIALYLSRAGVRVTMLEADQPGGTATRNSWAWINASWGNPGHYVRLRIRAMQEWHRLERTLPELRVSWSGGLNWECPSDQLQRFAAEHARWGYDVRCVGKDEASRIEPNLAAPPALAVHAPGEAAVEPLAAAHAILAAAVRLGCTVIANHAVCLLDMKNGRVCGVRTGADHFAADEVVVAAGAGAAALLATIGIHLPVRVLPSLLITSRPHAKLLNGLIMTPAAHIRQTTEGRVIACAEFDGVGSDDASNAAAALLEAMRRTFKSGESLTLERHVLGYRPIPEDGLPLVGPPGDTPGLYVAVTHSGITLAPAIGRFVAEEIVTARRNPLLKRYAPDRFREGSPQHGG